MTWLTPYGGRSRVTQRRVGSEAEALVERHHREAADLGLAWITKRPTPVRVTSVRGGRVEGFFERSPGVDYAGVLRGGRAVFAEAKSCRAGSFALREIEPEQWDEMARASALGALCVLLVAWTPGTRKGEALLGGRASALCAVPWSVVVSARERGDSSLSARTLAEYSTPAGALWVQTVRE